MNKLISWVVEKKGDKSTRQLAHQLDLSHSYIALILKGERPVSWEFAARVANRMGLDYMDAFQMAGLIPNKKGDSRAGAAPPSPQEKVSPSIPQSEPVVTR